MSPTTDDASETVLLLALPSPDSDSPLSPTRLPQWRPQPEPLTPEPIRSPAFTRNRRILHESLMATCFVLWSSIITSIASLLYCSSGIKVLATPDSPEILVFNQHGVSAIFIGSTIVGLILGAAAYVVWVAIVLYGEPVRLGRDGWPRGSHPMAPPLTLVSILAGVFAPALGVAVYPNHLVPFGFSALQALRVAGVGLSAIWAGILLVALVCGLGIALC
ncbi:hypothetical protein GY45DRAFT_109150 [Cubamyces sp. BRFM 1775]|nr:hypothetical protein GY45DRAFT_109150 [Cubamyces sp. BRFM 1775]